MDSAADSSSVRLRELQSELTRSVRDSRAKLNEALRTAWTIGHLLAAEKRRIHQRMGRGAWLAWLAFHFRDSQKRAARLMRLAEAIRAEKDFDALSLRQAYFRLSVPTEPKQRRATAGVPSLPNYVRHAQRVLLSVRMRLRLSPLSAEARHGLCQDLAPLYQQLAVLFGDTPDARRGHR